MHSKPSLGPIESALLIDVGELNPNTRKDTCTLMNFIIPLEWTADECHVKAHIHPLKATA